MSDKVSVSPKPIQRNPLDVATELTELHISKFGVSEEDEIATLFSKYYATAYLCKASNLRELRGLVPEEILKKMNM